MSDWTKERIALLMRLHDEGLTCSQIANRMGGLSRSAVIGKIHRLGLARQRSKPAAKPVMQHVVKANRTPRQSVRPTQLMRPPSAILRRDPAGLPICEIFVAPKDRKGIVDLEDRDCRWPIGDPLHATFHFCGREKFGGLPYCAHHAQIAYVPPEPQRKRGASKTSESDTVRTPTAVNDNNNVINSVNSKAKEMA
jgi:GcrA cell cycle regulator